jgi:hypothetical protein
VFHRVVSLLGRGGLAAVIEIIDRFPGFSQWFVGIGE